MCSSLAVGLLSPAVELADSAPKEVGRFAASGPCHEPGNADSGASTGGSVLLAAMQTFVGVANAGFETGTGWTGLTTGESVYYGPVEGSRYAVLTAAGEAVVQETGIVVEAGRRYDITVWARSIYDDAHTGGLAAATYQQMPAEGTTARAMAQLIASAAGFGLATSDVDVSPRTLQGAAATVLADDGANVWIDGDYRVQFNTSMVYQPIASDPIADPWLLLVDSEYDQDMAIGVVSIPGGQRFIFDCYYLDDPPLGEAWESLITLRAVGGAPLDYAWGPRLLVLFNESLNNGGADDPFPWVIDPHAFWDPETSRLWMSWGGHDLYVTELDPASGRPIDANGGLVDPDLSGLDPNVTDDPVHTMVVEERPEQHLDDPWRRSNYQEGPAIYKHGGYFYYFATYGHLAYDYTIRVGRSKDPRGPYLDREGVPLLNGGGTFLLGDDTDHLVPGHPHIWEEEDGTFYMGYDYRTTRDHADGEIDFMGIRRLYWVDGWPTIWQPVTVSFFSDNHPGAIGQRLTVSVANGGDPGSVLAVDRVSVEQVSQIDRSP